MSRIHHPILSVLLLAVVSSGVWAGQTGTVPTPGFDRVGTNVTGGMRGLADDHVQGSRVASDRRTEAAHDARAGERKSELARRMFWIMMSMR